MAAGLPCLERIAPAGHTVAAENTVARRRIPRGGDGVRSALCFDAGVGPRRAPCLAWCSPLTEAPVLAAKEACFKSPHPGFPTLRKASS